MCETRETKVILFPLSLIPFKLILWRTDILTRISVYTVPSAAAAYTSLLPDFLPPRSSLPHTVVIISLDWTRPWSFVEELQTWLVWLEQWAKGDGSRELEIVREENHERRTSVDAPFIASINNFRSPSTYTTLLRAFNRARSNHILTLRHLTTSWPGYSDA